MGTVFISYRRGDSEGQARALFSHLSEAIGRDAVFMDVDSIALGRDFREVLHERLASCDSMLVLIGPDWLTARDSAGRGRLGDPSDFVRQEIAAALKRKIPVTPVLLQGARVPEPSQLPEDLKDLAYRNGFELSHARWDSDVREMLQRLGMQHAPGTASSRGKTSSWRWGAVAVIALIVGALVWTGVSQYLDDASTSRANETAGATAPAGTEPSSPPPASTPQSRETASIELEYAVGSGEVFLEITVGSGQFGTSRISLDDRVVNTGRESSVSLGPGSALAGKVLAVTTIVNDISAATNSVGVRYRLSGGPNQFPWTVSNPVNTEGGMRTFRTSVRLVR